MEDTLIFNVMSGVSGADDGGDVCQTNDIQPTRNNDD